MKLKEIINFSSLSLSFSLLVFLFSLFILSSICFILHLSINVFCFPLSLIISQLVLYYLECERFKFSKKTFVINSLIFFVIIFLSCALMVNFYDYSYDGRTYHQAQIMLLAQGWNPVYDNISEFVFKNYPTTLYHLPWIEGYTKFVEIVQSNILVVFKNIETAKMTHLVSVIMLFLYAFYVFGKKAFDKLHLLFRILLSLIVVLNPVFVGQFFTFYVDLYTYVFFMLILLAVFDLETETECCDNIIFSIIVMGSVCFLNIKFWSYIYFCTLGLIYLVYLLVNKKTDKIKKVFLSSCVILILVIVSGLNPYLTNLRQGRNIIYPVLGSEEAMRVMEVNIPATFNGKNYLHQFFLSTFSKVDNFRMMDKKAHQLKVPFEADSEEFNYLTGYDTRICGFGIFWSGILLLASILVCFIRFKEKKVYLLVFLILLANILFQPFGWWARFIPQLWAFPVFVILYFLSEQNVSKTKQILASFILLVMFSNISVQSYFVIQSEKFYKEAMDFVLASLVKYNKPVLIYTIYDWAIVEKLREHGIKTEFVSQEYFENNKEKFQPVALQMENNMFWKLKE